MKLATLKGAGRDGELVVVSRNLRSAIKVPFIAPTLQWAVENWDTVFPQLQLTYRRLNAGALPDAFDFRLEAVSAPLPRAYQWLDGSAFMSHGRRMEKAFNLGLENEYEAFPLMYQGGSDDFLGPYDDVGLPDQADGIDFEGELAVVVDDVPLGTDATQAESHIKLLMLLNDVSLRALGPREMATGFGFIQAKPSTAFAGVAITPDELGQCWNDGRVHLPLQVDWNDVRFGQPDASEMSFSFPQLIAHAAKTRRLGAGTIIGSGTISNTDRCAGVACISERRAIEIIEHGGPITEFMRFGDKIRMEMYDQDGQSLFGAIDQRIVQCTSHSRIPRSSNVATLKESACVAQSALNPTA